MTNLNGALNGNSKMAMNNLAEKSFTSRHSIIPLYLPNIVGYLRIACTTVSIASGKVLSSFPPRPALLFFSLFVSSLTSRTNPRPRPYAFSLCFFYFFFHFCPLSSLAFSHPRSMLIFYFISFVCDELDGRLARLFSQQSTYGAVLDMVTDRLSTAALLGILAVLYPSKAQICVFLQALDIASHWCHMYASLVSGGTSHKELSNHHNWLVRSYYANRIFMGTCCVSCELLYLSLYAMHWPIFNKWSIVLSDSRPEVSIFLLFAQIAIPGFIIKQTINVIQLVQSMNGLWLHDLKNM